MTCMKRLIALLPIAALLLATACNNMAAEKQWYKPNVNYTAADFERDRTACTDQKSKTLDESCMKDRGWVALGGDIGPPVKAPDPTTNKGGSRSKY
jgi:PBP1b-binding outer membrane lipoprotein LpoB